MPWGKGAVLVENCDCFHMRQQMANILGSSRIITDPLKLRGSHYEVGHSLISVKAAQE